MTRSVLNYSTISKTTNFSSDSDEFDVSRGPTPVSSKKRSALSLTSLGLSDLSAELRACSPWDECKEFQSDEEYLIMKEMLCGEWTTRNDLKLINEHYFGELKRNASEKCHVVDDFVAKLANIEETNAEHIIELEQSIKNWKDASVTIGNTILCIVHNAIPQFRSLITQMPVFVAAMHQLTTMHGQLAEGIRTLNDEGLFFVDILWMLVRLAHKTLVWQNIFARLVESFLQNQHVALSQCRLSLDKVSTFNKETKRTRESVLDYVKIIELERILNAPRQLVQPNRKFLREGFAQVCTAQGLVPSMIVLFRDSLLVASASEKPGTKALEFFINNHIPLRDITYEDGNSIARVDASSSPLCISILYCGQTFVLSFTSEAIKDLWIRDLDNAVRSAKETPVKSLPAVLTPLERRFVSFSDSVVSSQRNGSTKSPNREHEVVTSPSKLRCSKSKTPFVSCWNHQQTIDAATVRRNVALRGQAGYLARHRFVVDEWQNFWGVVSSHSLILFTSHEDLKPVAFIPLIGCSVSVPALNEVFSESPTKSTHVFKIESKPHQSFIFRVHNSYDLARWINEVHESSLSTEPLDPLTTLAITR
ncbi:hypothetical protein L596_015082 [Steinernema carpocapsae]|uniref:PH domain-containing protein n=1 Tax=Steinernema carpocapsae TaxID=34508 RepID=A0A4U5NE48_STECR|nr:hypothetical protein L596_015082 [Steinernema carpocapsae]